MKQTNVKTKIQAKIDPKTGRKTVKLTPLQIEVARLKVLLGTATDLEKKMAAVEY